MNIALDVSKVYVDRFQFLHSNIGDVLAVVDKSRVLESLSDGLLSWPT